MWKWENSQLPKSHFNTMKLKKKSEIWQAGLNRFYYLLYKRYNNLYSERNFVWCSVFISTYKIHSVSHFEIVERHKALSITLLRLWMWESRRTLREKPLAWRLSTVNFLSRNPFVVFLIFPHLHMITVSLYISIWIPLTTPTPPSQNNFSPPLYLYLHLAARSR